MVGLQKLAVERVAIRGQHVEVTIAVEVHQLNPVRAKRRVPTGEQRLLVELEPPLVDERHDRFMILADQRHEVGPAIPIQIAHRDMNGAMAVIEFVQHKLGRPPRGACRRSAILQQQHPPRLDEAELPHHQVEIAIAIEIGWPHVGDPPQPPHQHLDRRLLPPRPFRSQQADLATVMIARLVTAQRRHHKFFHAIAVEVDRLDVGRLRQAPQHQWVRHPGPNLPALDHPRRHVAREQPRPPRRANIPQRHVSHSRHLGRPFGNDRLGAEPKRGRMPGFHRGDKLEAVRGLLAEVIDHVTDGRHDQVAATRLEEQVEAAIDFFVPELAGKTLRVRSGVAGSAEPFHCWFQAGQVDRTGPGPAGPPLFGTTLSPVGSGRLGPLASCRRRPGGRGDRSATAPRQCQHQPPNRPQRLARQRRLGHLPRISPCAHGEILERGRSEFPDSLSPVTATCRGTPACFATRLDQPAMALRQFVPD